MVYYPPSPPSSTSLPSHFSYPLYGSDPPPTDGPNTREKLRMGLLPRSGRVGPPLPPRKDDEGYDWQGLEGEGEGDRSWDSQGTVGDQENSTTSTSEPYYSTLESASPYPPSSIPDSFVDPILHSSVTSTSSLYSSQDINDSGDFSFYPPSLPLPSVHERQESKESYESFEENQRIVSNATIIDYGDRQEYYDDQEEEEEEVKGRKQKSPKKVANGLGMTKEEWLRLGGFLDDSVEEPETHHHHQDVFTLPPKLDKPITSSSLNFTLPPPIFPPTPIEPSPDSSTFSYFAPSPPPPPPLSVWERQPLTAADLSLPTPPTHFQVPLPIASTPKSSPTKHRSALPSPLKQQRSRPEPYPTTSTIISQPLPTTSQELQLPPLSPSTLRNLTPVSTALLQYSHYPVPSLPPAPTEFPKKSHGRRTSIGHIPRPRNAFILFRSHAVCTGLIPKSAGVKDAKNVSQIIGRVWKGLNEGDRREWEELARMEKLDHARKWPGYKYTPRQRKNKGDATAKKKKGNESDGEWEEIGDASPVKKSSKKRGEKKRMELIGTSLLESEYGGQQAQLPSLPQTLPFTPPRPRYPTGDILVSSSPTPTPSTIQRSSPHAHSQEETTPTKFRPLPSSTSSPASSSSPSPQRMSLPYSRPSPNVSPSKKKHPLSNSHDPTSSNKKSHYSRAGLGITSSSQSQRMDQIPLFSGPTESRQFSLGKFALDPFNNQQQQTRKPTLTSSRELLAQQQEETCSLDQRDFTSIDPREFLDLTSQTQLREEEEFSTWDDTSSSYSTAPTTISSNWNRPLDFGQQPQCGRLGGGGILGGQGQGQGNGGMFHFGTMDLFAKPKNSLFGAASSKSSSGTGTQEREKEGNGMVGLGIRWEEGGSGKK